MQKIKISASVCAYLLTGAEAFAETTKTSATPSEKTNNGAPATPSAKNETPKRGTLTKGKKAESNLRFFEGCGRKDKAGKWAEFYSNCETEVDGKEIPAPPCRAGWVRVAEAVPQNLVSHLQQCMYEL